MIQMMAVIVTTCQEFGLMVSESKTETMRLWSAPSSTETTLDIKAAGQRYQQTEKFVYLGGYSSDPDTQPCWISVDQVIGTTYEY